MANKQLLRVAIDCNSLKTKVDYLSLLLNCTDYSPEKIESLATGLSRSLILGECHCAIAADGVLELRQVVDFGGQYNELVANLIDTER
ncbi:hypothetical protein [Serratia marcescens]|uniref:hypothetical protein n=1 Tax=Serratia marcescens TaxID=615 RepID=UPI00148D3701|nr:hypothetical protein [Serratia marcescens]QJU39664.1 hypothetical protein HMI62_10195 [Serratia marcescens]